ncbi:MAG: Fe-S cluster domain-containing protein [Mangrovibacterium sp.]
MTLIYTVVTLVAIGSLAAVILYFVAQKFYVYEDPRIDEVESALPSANCGGCGFAGCRAFAEACVKSESFDGLNCPVGGNDTMQAVAGLLGREAVAQMPKVAVLRCNGSCSVRPRTNIYDGAQSCAMASSLYGGDTGCSFGCLGLGDCEVSCDFDALHVNSETGLPEIDDAKCTACGACVKACPKLLIELRKKSPKDRKIYVACRNEDKGGVAKKACSAACIGCSKCVKECNFEAITVTNNLAFIDSEKCKLCRKCVEVCPTNAILEFNFPARKPKTDLPPEAPAAIKKSAVPAKEHAVADAVVSEETKEENNENK